MKFPVVAATFLLVLSANVLSAGEKMREWKKLSRPEKVWTALHPYKAKIVYKCALLARTVTDSLEKNGVFTDRNGGQLDAFRHAYWSALMMQQFSEQTVRRVGENHEKGNYIDFRKGKLEDGDRSDSLASVMDLRNNESGIEIAKVHAANKSASLIQLIIEQIWNGKLCILKKDALGNYLNAKDEVINADDYKNKWFIPKCIVSSDAVLVKH